MIKNNSDEIRDFCIFQTNANIKDPYIKSLAWQVLKLTPNAMGRIMWTMDYNFVWAQTGHLQAGGLFKTAEMSKATPFENNAITFTKKEQSYQFIDLTTDRNYTGLLHVKNDPTIALQEVSVGSGMSNAAVFARQAEPNMSINFPTQNEYVITFGYFTKGEVLDTNQISNSAVIKFPPNVYEVTAILNPDNTWSLQTNE
ncbi:MAG: hypothetical protein AAF611_01185 [Bacteroidota bacterium]